MAERYTRLANQYEEYEGWFFEDKAKQCRKESAEYWQIMYWLKELKGEK